MSILKVHSVRIRADAFRRISCQFLWLLVQRSDISPHIEAEIMHVEALTKLVSRMQHDPDVHLLSRDAQEHKLKLSFKGQIDNLLYFIRFDALLYRYPRVRLR